MISGSSESLKTCPIKIVTLQDCENFNRDLIASIRMAEVNSRNQYIAAFSGN